MLWRSHNRNNQKKLAIAVDLQEPRAVLQSKHDAAVPCLLAGTFSRTALN